MRNRVLVLGRKEKRVCMVSAGKRFEIQWERKFLDHFIGRVFMSISVICRNLTEIAV